jgi:hypothetical protein
MFESDLNYLFGENWKSLISESVAIAKYANQIRQVKRANCAKVRWRIFTTHEKNLIEPVGLKEFGGKRHHLMHAPVTNLLILSSTPCGHVGHAKSRQMR